MSFQRIRHELRNKISSLGWRKYNCYGVRWHESISNDRHLHANESCMLQTVECFNAIFCFVYWFAFGFVHANIMNICCVYLQQWLLIYSGLRSGKKAWKTSQSIILHMFTASCAHNWIYVLAVGSLVVFNVLHQVLEQQW